MQGVNRRVACVMPGHRSDDPGTNRRTSWVMPCGRRRTAEYVPRRANLPWRLHVAAVTCGEGPTESSLGVVSQVGRDGVASGKDICSCAVLSLCLLRVLYRRARRLFGAGCFKLS